MKKKLALAIAVAGMVSAIASPASAAKPANQACFGKDFSGYARNFNPLGQLLTSFEVAGTPIVEGGLGEDVQSHPAGNVPDTIFPNVCND